MLNDSMAEGVSISDRSLLHTREPNDRRQQGSNYLFFFLSHIILNLYVHRERIPCSGELTAAFEKF